MLNIRSVSVLTAVALGATLLSAADASAQHRGGGVARGGAVGRAVPRVYAPGRPFAPIYRGYPARVIAPRIVNVVPYRPYFYPYRPGLTVGFYSSLGYPYRYGYYGYPYYGYSTFGYDGYVVPPPAYVTAVPGYSYGGVRIEGAPPDAQVFADGYYVGIVDDFDGALQHLNLQAGAHRIEIRAPGLAPVTFDVNVLPGQTITYHAGQPY
jgi:hypothetical protein